VEAAQLGQLLSPTVGAATSALRRQIRAGFRCASRGPS
jgi:hypothetical protein